MRLAITGADGFVGRAVVRHLAAMQFDGEVRLFDRAFASAPPFATIMCDLSDKGGLRDLLEFADCIIHLAALPGAAAQSDPQASRRINLDLPLNLIDGMQGKHLVYSSSIAVLGSQFDDTVDDYTQARPEGVYATHKRMVELAFTDAVRRGALSGVALRVPAVVARPVGSSEGFASAFLSEIFHAVCEGYPYTLPVGRDATSWVISAQCCAANFVKAALSGACEAAPANMPALHIGMGELVDQLVKSRSTCAISYDEQPGLRRAFGSYPRLETKRSRDIGLTADADLTALIDNVYSQLSAAPSKDIR